MKRYRNEWKFIVDQGQIALLRQRLESLLEKDPHAGPDGLYTIHSLYFDDWKDRCYRENDSGWYNRFKYRIRYYGSNNGEIHLERKEKLYGRCHKDECLITRAEYDALCSGDVAELACTAREPLVRQLCGQILTAHFEPKIIIDYERAAFVDFATNVRITLDMNISASWDLPAFLEGGYQAYPLQAKGRHVLEVKFDDILPGHMRAITSSPELIQTAFSKYYLGRRYIGGIYR